MSLLSKKKKNPEQGVRMLDKRLGKKLKDIRQTADQIEDEDEDDSVVKSIFAGHATRLAKIEATSTSETYDIECLKAVKALLLDLIPVAEENYRKFPAHTAASALNQLISQLREASADQRSLESFQERADRIIEIVVSEYTNITENFILNVNELEGKLRKTSDVKQELQEFMRQHAKTLQNSRTEVRDRVYQMMVSSNDKKRGR